MALSPVRGVFCYCHANPSAAGMDNSVMINEALESLVYTLDVDEPSDPSLRFPATLEDLKAFLITRITFLLDQNPALLMSILYRIDVEERKVMNTLSSAPPDELSSRLADLMIERELQKIQTRRAFRESE